MYSVHILNENGHGSYLSAKGKSTWKTKAIAIKHAKDIIAIKNKSHRFAGMIEASVEDEHGETITSFRSGL